MSVIQCVNVIAMDPILMRSLFAKHFALIGSLWLTAISLICKSCGRFSICLKPLIELTHVKTFKMALNKWIQSGSLLFATRAFSNRLLSTVSRKIYTTTYSCKLLLLISIVLLLLLLLFKLLDSSRVCFLSLSFT